MTPAARAFWGAMLGALLTLALHPASRPFILGTASRLAPDYVSDCLDTDTSQLAPPKDLVGASLWIQVALDRIATERIALQKDEFDSVLKVCDAAIERESQNAFWYQAKAALLAYGGRRDETLEVWERGARCGTWRDYQTERLLASQQQLAGTVGARQAWQYAYVYYARSDAAAALIERTARQLLSEADYKSRRGLEIRYATLENGDLMRVNGRAVRVSMHGANIVELAAYPQGMTTTPSPKTLWIGRTELLANLRNLSEDNFKRANEIFRANDADRALVFDDKYSQFASQMSLGAVLATEMPVASIAIMMLGGSCWLIGYLLGRKYGDAQSYPPLGVGFVTLLAAASVYWLSENVAAALAVGLSCAFLLIRPNHARHVQPEDLGPLFTFVMLVLATAAAGAFGLWVIASSGPAIALSSAIDLPQNYYERPALAGLAAVFLALICIAGPLWALVHRVGTPHVVSTGLRRAGIFMGLGGLLLTVVLSPVAVYFDRTLTESFSRLVANEPVYYLVNERRLAE